MDTELGRSQVEVQRCTLSWEVGKELGEELARRKCRWKLMQTWSRRNWRRRGRTRRRRRTTLIKSNNPHLAGGEKHTLKQKSYRKCTKKYSNRHNVKTQKIHMGTCALTMPCLETKNAHGRRCIFWWCEFLAT